MKIIHIISSFLLLFILNSCKKDNVKITYVPAYLKQMLPYDNGQSLQFINNNGIIIDSKISITSGISENSNCASCPVTSREEGIRYEFKVGVSPFITISVDVRPIIFMIINSPLHDYRTGGGFDFLIEEGNPRPVCNASRQTCLDNIVLNGQTYNNILEIISGANGDNDITKAYFSPTQGLIGFRYGSGLTYIKR